MSQPREASSTFAALVSEFTSFYAHRIRIVKAHGAVSEDIHRSKEELTQAAFLRCWERLCDATVSNEEIHNIRSLFWKSALRTEKQRAGRTLRKQWLLLQKSRIMSGSGSFKAPESPENSEIGVGQRTDWWQEQLAEDEAVLHELVEKLQAARHLFTRQEELVLTALISGLPGKEAATALGVTETSFRQTIFRLRAKLKKAIPK